MTLNQFKLKNSDSWKQLEYIIKELKSGGIKKLDKNDINNLLYLYNSVSSHLSYSRTFFGPCDLTNYLNNLISQAHNYIYTTKTSRLSSLNNFFKKEFPLMIYDNLKFLTLSTVLFIIGFAASFYYTYIFPDNAAAFLPSQILNGIKFEDIDRSFLNGSVMSSYILTNNIKVGFMAFSLGITLGIGTLYVLLTNGFILGSIAALAVQNNYSFSFWALIVPHGVIELFAIFLCGGAGLILGYSIINPKTLSRRDSIILGSKKSIRLVLGTIPLFVIAGIIEGNFTPLGIDNVYKYLFALFTLILLVVYVIVPNIRYRKEITCKN